MYLKVTAIGNLSSDPELRYLPDGQAVTNFSMATNRKWTSSDGHKQEQVTWLRVSVWGKQAEAVNEHMSKGRQVFIEGELQPDKATGGPRIWTDNDGNARASFEIRARLVQFLGGGSQGDNTQGSQQSSGSAKPVEDGEIPF